MPTLKLSIRASQQEQEILMAKLEAFFYAFQEDDNSLLCYCTEKEWNENKLRVENVLRDKPFNFYVELIADENWNETWEKNFKPITIADKVHIRASFHESPKQELIDIIINPKMSFGTGHHATTEMMMELMLDLNLGNRSVLDFGAGTGILSVLASKLYSKSIVSIDNEEWAYNNMIENFELNHVRNTSAKLGSADQISESKFDVVLANINRHILLEYLPALISHMSTSGILLLSGILETDVEEMKAFCESINLQHQKTKVRNNWASMQFQLN